MIGHYVNNLTREQESRVLTLKLEPGWFFNPVTGERCLQGAATGMTTGSPSETEIHFPGQQPRFGGRYGPDMGGGYDHYVTIGLAYLRLCVRFGGTRVNAAVRNRILSNRARRTLSRETVVAVEAPTAA